MGAKRIMVSALALLVAFAAAAQAGPRYKTVSTFTYSPLLITSFYGEVGSEHEICVEGRRVTLFKDLRRKDKRIASTLADADGDWTIPTDAAQGKRYYAKVKASNPPGPATCLAYRTRGLTPNG